jgi:serine/threonine protein kinase
VDWWSVGIYAFQLLFDRVPFQHPDPYTLERIIQYEQIKADDFIDDRSGQELPKDAKDFILGLLANQPDERLGKDGWESVLDSKWIESANYD